MQYILMLERVFRVTNNKSSIHVGHRVIDIKTEVDYILRRSAYTNVYLLQRVGDDSDSTKVDRIVSLDPKKNSTHLTRVVTYSSRNEYRLMLESDGEERDKNNHVFCEMLNAFVNYDYAKEEKKRDVVKQKEPILAKHETVQKMRDVLELEDDAVRLLNKYAYYTKKNDNEYPIPLADLDDIIRIRVESNGEFVAFIKELVKYANVKHVQSVACRYCTNSANNKTENFRRSNTKKLSGIQLVTSDFDTLFVQFELSSFSGKSMLIAFRISFTVDESQGNSIVCSASTMLGNQRNYKALGLEQFINECKERVLGDKYNPELQYTKLDGVI